MTHDELDEACYACDSLIEDNEGYPRDYCEACFENAISELVAEREEYARTCTIVVERLALSAAWYDQSDDEQDDVSMLYNDESPYMRALRRYAFEHAEQLHYEYTERAGESYYQREFSTIHSDRQVANLLRHAASNYDEILEELPTELDNLTEPVLPCWDDSVEIIRQRVHDSLKNVYPEAAEILDDVDLDV